MKSFHLQQIELSDYVSPNGGLPKNSQSDWSVQSSETSRWVSQNSLFLARWVCMTWSQSDASISGFMILSESWEKRPFGSASETTLVPFAITLLTISQVTGWLGSTCLGGKVTLYLRLSGRKGTCYFFYHGGRIRPIYPDSSNASINLPKAWLGSFHGEWWVSFHQLDRIWLLTLSVGMTGDMKKWLFLRFECIL